MISLEKLLILTPFKILHKNVGDLGKFIVVKGFKKLPKVQKMAQSGHTDSYLFQTETYKQVNLNFKIRR